jgi:hypothetical protein
MWVALFIAVVYHEATCKPGQLLSEEVDRSLEKHPWITYGFTLITVSHLMNWLPNNLDPYHRIGKKKNV